MYNFAQLFYSTEDNHADKGFEGNYVIAVGPRGLDTIQNERENGGTIFYIDLHKHVRGQEKKHVARYDVDMLDLEIFAKTILAHVESVKYYKSDIMQDKINRGDVI